MKKVIATMIGIAFAFCCFMLYESWRNDANVTEESVNDMYYPSNLELIEVSIETLTRK